MDEQPDSDLKRDSTAPSEQQPRRITAAQAAARAENGRKHSTGPKTREGKEASKLNAVRHGGYSSSPVISTGLLAEDHSVYEEFRDGIVDSLLPDGMIETHLAGNIASLLWRSRRPSAYEAAFLAKEFSGALPFQLAHALHQLPSEEAAVRVMKDPEGSHSPEDWHIAAIMCGHAISLDMDDNWPLPRPVDRVGWNALVDRILSDAGRTRGFTIERMERRVADARSVIDELLPVVQRGAAAKVVAEDLLLKITRVEGHLGRELSRALAQLRALQEQRRAHGDE